MIDFGNHLLLIGRAVQLLHIVKTVAVSGHDADMQLQGHGHDAAILMGFQAARGNQALGLDNGPGDAKSVGPMVICRGRRFEEVDVDLVRVEDQSWARMSVRSPTVIDAAPIDQIWSTRATRVSL